MYRKIAINGRFLSRRVTGVERYALEMIKELDKICSKNSVILLIPSNAKTDLKLENIEVKELNFLSGIIWEHITLSLYCLIHEYLVLNFCNTAPLLNPGIVVMHDAKFMVHPEFFSLKFKLWYNLLFSNQARRCKKIITVSNFSKHEIEKYLNVKKERIVVIYSAWQHFSQVSFDDNALEKYKLKTQQYYFCLSSLEPNKNFKWIAEVARKTPDSLFVVAGSINEKVFSHGLGFECPPNMKLIGYVSDEESKTLMRDCKAFLFPTIYEGFGLPPLEALSAGCKNIVVSDTEVMHEIYGNFPVYISPTIYDFKINDKEVNSESLLLQYSWNKSAVQLMNLLKRYIKI